jgi:hypothetical protein
MIPHRQRIPLLDGTTAEASRLLCLDDRLSNDASTDCYLVTVSDHCDPGGKLSGLLEFAFDPLIGRA